MCAVSFLDRELGFSKCSKSLVNWGFLQHPCIIAWEIHGGPHFTSYIAYATPHYNFVFFLKRPNHNHDTWWTIPLSTIHISASIWLSLHYTWYETMQWGHAKNTCLVNYPYFSLWIVVLHYNAPPSIIFQLFIIFSLEISWRFMLHTVANCKTTSK